MNKPSNVTLDGETRITTALGEPAEGDRPLPKLTILGHPNSNRVGECLTLKTLAIGREVLLSRIEPVFSKPSGEESPLGQAGNPLGGLYISRQPIRLRPASEPGSLVIDLRTTRTRVEANSERIEQERVFSSEEIDAGVVLRLARKVVLLLHRSLTPRSLDKNQPAYGLVGASPSMMNLRQEIRRLAPLDVPVLLRGETGTGKELVARALYENSPRRYGPFIAVNMGVLEPSLAAAALFGAERGAYTGADRKRPGFFQSAHGGTLFLDEIGEAPPEVQVMLLRTLETQKIQPVGCTDSIKVDVRIIAATDTRLEEAMHSGRFKMPLYHRLAGYAVHLPPLRERREDIGQLLDHFLNEELSKLGTPARHHGDPDDPWPPSELIVRMARHSWPGNVRELRNVARRLAVVGREQPVPDLEVLLPSLTPQRVAAHPNGLEDPSESRKPTKPTSKKRRTLRKLTEIDEAELLEALRENRWHLKATAAALNISRPNLYRLVDATPSIRTAQEIPQEEIEAAVAEATGDLDTAADQLEVSIFGLKRRMKALGLPLN